MQLKVTFKEGGAFDFHTKFEQIKERLAQVVDNTGESSGRGLQAVNLSAVHLDELPAYDGRRNPSQAASLRPPPPVEAPSGRQASEAGPEPMDPPPCYEEVQQQSVADELEERLRHSS